MSNLLRHSCFIRALKLFIEFSFADATFSYVGKIKPSFLRFLTNSEATRIAFFFQLIYFSRAIDHLMEKFLSECSSINFLHIYVFCLVLLSINNKLFMQCQ